MLSGDDIIGNKSDQRSLKALLFMEDKRCFRWSPAHTSPKEAWTARYYSTGDGAVRVTGSVYDVGISFPIEHYLQLPAKQMLILNYDSFLLCSSGLLSKWSYFELYKHADVTIVGCVSSPLTSLTLHSSFLIFILIRVLIGTIYFYRHEGLSRLFVKYEPSSE